MTTYLFPPRQQPTLPVVGQDSLYPVARIFCVGRNYVEHAIEMGGTVDREAPFYFTKSPYALLGQGEAMSYPPGTADLHHEVELVAAIGATAVRMREEDALSVVAGYAVGLDMTRRDLQAKAKDKRRPWDTAKDFEASAIVGPLTPAGQFGPPGPQRMTLTVNGDLRQDTLLSEMVWSLPGIIAHLSTLYQLAAGDLIMTGTPAGVAAVVAGDKLSARIEGLAPLDVAIVA